MQKKCFQYKLQTKYRLQIEEYYYFEVPNRVKMENVVKCSKSEISYELEFLFV